MDKKFFINCWCGDNSNSLLHNLFASFSIEEILSKFILFLNSLNYCICDIFKFKSSSSKCGYKIS